MAMHVLFLFLKKQSAVDNFFSLHSKTDEKSLIKRFLLLSQMNCKDYSAEMMVVKNMFKDGRLDDRELERLDSLVKERYFDDSYSLRITWKRTDTSLRWISSVIVLSIMCAVCIALGAELFAKGAGEKINYNDPAILNGFYLFPIGLVLGILLHAFYGAFLLLISMFFPAKGSVNRARVCLDRFWAGIAYLFTSAFDKVSPSNMKEE